MPHYFAPVKTGMVQTPNRLHFLHHVHPSWRHRDWDELCFQLINNPWWFCHKFFSHQFKIYQIKSCHSCVIYTLQTALSMFFQESTVPSCRNCNGNHACCHYPVSIHLLLPLFLDLLADPSNYTFFFDYIMAVNWFIFVPVFNRLEHA